MPYCRDSTPKTTAPKPLILGDELTISMWVDGKQCLFQTKNQHGEAVFDQGVMKFA